MQPFYVELGAIEQGSLCLNERLERLKAIKKLDRNDELKRLHTNVWARLVSIEVGESLSVKKYFYTCANVGCALYQKNLLG